MAPTDPHHLVRVHSRPVTVEYDEWGEAGRATPETRRMVWLAVATCLAFGLVCSVLGWGVARTQAPCPTGCTRGSLTWVMERFIVLGPPVAALVGAVVSLVAVRRPWSRRPWQWAVYGVLAAIVTVLACSVPLW